MDSKTEKEEKEPHQIFHNEARKIAGQLNKQILTFSTGIIALFFALILEKKITLAGPEKLLIWIALFNLATSSLTAMQVIQWEANRNYLLGHIFDPAKKGRKDVNLEAKRKLERKLRLAKTIVRLSFLIGLLSIAIFLAIRIA